MSLLLPGSDGFEEPADAGDEQRPIGPVGTGIGSMPGGDPLAVEAANARSYTEATRVVLDQLDALAHVPELPGRGAAASMIGRTLGLLGELSADLQPAGWRLTGVHARRGVDQRRARSLLAQDLDTVEELSQGFDGVFKTQVTGPWTLAASVEKPRGDKVLSDHGARRDLAYALADALGDHVADLRRRVPTASRLVVQVDEPALAAVMNAQIPTASGFGKHRTIHPPEASALLEVVLGAISTAGAEPWVHSCAPGIDWTLVSRAGASGLLVDLALADAEAIEHLAAHLEAGGVLGLGVVPSTDPVQQISDKAVTEKVLRWLDMIGFDPEEVADRVVVTPSCGLAGASAAWSRRALTLAATTGRNLA